MSKNPKHPTPLLQLDVPILTRVEGEGALSLTIQNHAITQLELKIFEPPRLFEKFLETRSYQEVIDMVARICGICPVAYQMSACRAIEQCFNMPELPWVRAMRRVFYCGEWLESHSTHIHFLALPDYFQCESALELAKIQPELMQRGLRLQALGHGLLKLFGGRAVHPVGACVGGFYQAPTASAYQAMIEQAQQAVNDVRLLIQDLAQLPREQGSQDFTTVSLYHPHEYPFNDGLIVSNRGHRFEAHEFLNHVEEHQVPYSTALHSLLDQKPYLVGPLARINHCYGHLPAEIHLFLESCDLHLPLTHRQDSILARAIEMYFCILETLRILKNPPEFSTAMTEPTPKAGLGFGATEAPRGLLWQSWEMDDLGHVVQTRIIPPTSQNQAQIESDLRETLTQFGLHHPKDDLKKLSERIIRSYDPCISCATHFLTLDIRS